MNSIADLIALEKDMKGGHKGRFNFAQIEKVHKKNKRRRWNNAKRK